MTSSSSWNDPEYSEWYSGNYGGCTLCHYAHAKNKSILTNQELATADQNFREWFAVGNTPIVVTTFAVGAPAIAPSAYDLAGVTCLSNPICATLIGAGGTRAGNVVLSGHGEYNPANGTTTIPRGTTLQTYAQLGETITDELGNAIETGVSVTPVNIYGPGAQAPNLTLLPPTGLNIMGNPITVSRPTLLSEILAENMGIVHWAACLVIKKC